MPPSEYLKESKDQPVVEKEQIDYIGRYTNEKSTEFLQCFLAPAGIEMLNLWNDFCKVVKFIDENPWVKSLLEKIIEKRS